MSWRRWIRSRVRKGGFCVALSELFGFSVDRQHRGFGFLRYPLLLPHHPECSAQDLPMHISA